MSRIWSVLRLMDRVGSVTAAVAIGLLAVMIACTLYEIVSRHFFNAPTIWSNDVSTMLNGSVFLLGAAYTLRRDGHVRIDFLIGAVPARLRHLIQAVFFLVLFLPALGYGTYFAVTKAWRAWERGTLETASAWEPLIWPFLTGIAIGLVGLLIQVVAESVRHLLAVGGHSDPAPSSDG
ncbi:TRAP transporter small permease subunit [Roseospira marina]|uniref:TRAP transporter small permease protein n=1 Tax=Roseospira marina TaxID=140057 RepID=A0A5M6IH29_9PROT|nr:TRAP transporter small permease subunit [Roseospira marina]KAA5607472.1 TRAP transporter small permease subunit [Roseospira marina]MBB4312347.1 TRAP-type mannitol/chloroaromatic compound transport system permease small subunit [Roseospira marina]MBB5085637.1 TRAP-type mannitol/chloroaromatic compound transport system permease small subunit [Roseospira marina]